MIEITIQDVKKVALERISGISDKTMHHGIRFSHLSVFSQHFCGKKLPYAYSIFRKPFKQEPFMCKKLIAYLKLKKNTIFAVMHSIDVFNPSIFASPH